MTFRWMSLVGAFLLFACGGPRVEGDFRVWHTVTLGFEGPAAHESDDDPNPFLDYRLRVDFIAPSGRKYRVPGFFDGDGEGGEAGSVWRVRFTPDEPGRWSYKTSFRSGPRVAVSLDAKAGEAAGFDGAEGAFEAAPRDPDAPGFARYGRLEYVGGHYLKFRDGPYWIRGGTDSPENFLAYAGFDNTPASHRYQPHESDWRPGDPDWGEGQGKAIIGALNSLADAGANSIYFLVMNIGGDGQDVWPWAGSPDPKGDPANDNLHFDLSKLRQWETVFDHAQRRGLFLHFVLNEAEKANKQELDDGELGVERKLYYREIIARFSHHLALQWNLSEEYDLYFPLGPERVRAFARYVAAVDPYRHPITVHPAGKPLEALRFTFGDPLFSMTSIQLNQRRIDELTEAFRRATAEAGRPLPISMDELTVEKGQAKSHIAVDDAELHRKQKLWPVYLSGGMIEFILEDMLEVESFKKPELQKLWRYVANARRFMEDNLPFWEMEPADELVEGEGVIRVGAMNGESFDLGAQVLAKSGGVYAIYFPRAQPTGTLDLSAESGTFLLRWFNPRSGEFEGEAVSLVGGGKAALGEPPSDAEEDWTALVEAR